MKKMLLKTLAMIFLAGVLSINGNATQTNIPGPAGSGTFGENVRVLPNGNLVVVDTEFDEGGVDNIGAVYLYDGTTLAVISTLKGSTLDDHVGNGGITVLTNGNFVVSSTLWDNGAATDAGAVTWCSATTGCNGAVTAVNSLVGDQTGDRIGRSAGVNGVTALTNGNYVVCSSTFDKPLISNVGAATWCDGSGGTVGPVSASNSLVGGTDGDSVGFGGAIALTNGNYVVISSVWNNPATGANLAGAVTWGNGAGGTVGLLTSANSLVGDQTDDEVGSTGVTALTNGNYVVSSDIFDKPGIADAGAVTWGNGAGGTVGTVAATNSLVGGSANDRVGSDGNFGNTVTALTNGNYVVSSANWDNPLPVIADVGAVTWGNGAGGTIGPVTSTNSLVGSTANDRVGGDPTLVGSSVTALTNGNYVVSSMRWTNPVGMVQGVGAVTWGNGAGGTVGLVTEANSLVGGSINDNVGGDAAQFGTNAHSVTALTNGNYVVASSSWNNPLPAISDVGAVTWGNGAGGTVGPVTSVNSLIGGSTHDKVGSLNAVTALTNGNYAVDSFQWSNPSGSISGVGAVTWGNGAGGTVGLINSSNSLVGGTDFDNVGSSGVTALTNGNYVVGSSNWNNPSTGITLVGAVTWCNGAGGTVGLVTPANSLVGGSINNHVGSDGTGKNSSIALTNGNYVVASVLWSNPSPLTAGVGAVTWGNGAGGTVGLVTTSNSLVGGSTSDNVGFGLFPSITAMTDGNYVVKSDQWLNPSGPIGNARAVSLGKGTGGTVGILSSANSVLGTATNGITGFSYDPTRRRLFVGRAPSNIVTRLFVDTTAIANGNIDNPANWDNGAPNALINAIIPTGRSITVNTAFTTGGLELASGATLVMNANLDIMGNLSLGQINTNTNTLGLSCSSAILGASSSNYIVGNLRKDFCATGGFTYPVGTITNSDEYSPVTINITALGVAPSSLTVSAHYGTVAPLGDGTTLDRYWTLTEAGDLTADLTFNYLQTDVDGNENTYRIIRVDSATVTSYPNQCPSAPCVDTAANTAIINGVVTFSDWTLGEPAIPTATTGTVSGRIVDNQGNPLEGAAVRLSGTQNRMTVTDALGRYRFDDVETNGFYTVTPARSNFSFSPSQRSFSQLGNNTDAAFTGLFDGSQRNPIDTAEYFVRQHYVDFLGREPDESGFNFWSDQITECGDDLDCVERRRENVSAAYFLSIEFQETGGLIDGLYRASYGRRPSFAEFMPDTAQVARNVIVGSSAWQQLLAANKQALIEAFVQRAAFRVAFDNLSDSRYVDELIAHTGISFAQSERDELVNGLANSTMTRAAVLLRITEDHRFEDAKRNEAFVMMEYFGYLRRDPDDSGYQFWLNKLNQFGGNFERAEMVKAFISSTEYRLRFPR